MNNIIELLMKNKETISTMESCTGGAIANYLTNIPNASQVFSFGAITYSNEYKMKFGVSKELIDKYTVYSMEVAREMSKCISNYTNSTYGVGVTGKLKKSDQNNPFGLDDVVYLSIYYRKEDKYYDIEIKLEYEERKDNKEQIINLFVDKMFEIIK